MSIIQEYADLKKQMEGLKDQFRKEGKAVLRDLAAGFFDTHQWVKNFGWIQYVPRFNDGEPCAFSCTADYPEINGDAYWNEEMGVTKEVFKEAYDDLRKRLSALDEDLLQALFGDGARVIVSRKGVKAEDYYD